MEYGFKDLFGNEIQVGDELLYYTISGNATYPNVAKVTGFKNGKVVLEKTAGGRASFLQRYQYAVVINDPYRNFHNNHDGLKKLWDQYKTFRSMST